MRGLKWLRSAGVISTGQNLRRRHYERQWSALRPALRPAMMR
jgi:hypothetical protein